MFRRRKLYKGIGIDDGFDENVPMARVIRELVPEDSQMDSDARERMMGHLLSVQRGAARGPARRTPARRALVPALAFALIIAIAAAVILPTLLGGKHGSTTPRSVAGFQKLVGDVQVRSNGASWKKASMEDAVATGWSVRTGVASFATVHFPDGSIMRVTDGSEAVVTRIGSGYVSIRHVSGSTYHRVRKGTTYVVTNQDVSSRARGTAFNVENRVPGHLEILTIESAVEVAIGKLEPIKVSQGEVMTVTMAEKKADKQPVSIDRLKDGRLMSSVQQDAEAGYPTGVYENVDLSRQTTPTTSPEQTTQPTAAQPTIQLAGDVAETNATLNWTVSAEDAFRQFILLRSEGSEPEYPEDEVASYSDTSISSASDNSITAGHTYQYRIAAKLTESGDIVYSNTVVLNAAVPQKQPDKASVSISANPAADGIDVEWSVTGAETYSGFEFERVVEKAPAGSPTPEGTTTTRRIESGDVFYSYFDSAVLPGHTYSYRVGLIVNGTVMVYSDWTQAEFVRK